MKNNLFLHPKIQLFIRIITGIASLIILASNIRIIITNKICYSHSNEQFWFYEIIIQNWISFILLVIVLIFPYRIEILSIVCFLYSLTCIIFEPNNPMGTLMYILSVAILHCRGYFIKKKLLKNILAFLLYLLLTFTEIRFGINNFMTYLINRLGYAFVECITILSIIFYYHLFYKKKESSTLDISKYKELNKRDYDWLKIIQQYNSYKDISNKYNVSEGTIRNRFSLIYKVLEVHDKKEFLSLYGEYKIIYGKGILDSESNDISLEESEQPATKNNPVISN